MSNAIAKVLGVVVVFILMGISWGAVRFILNNQSSPDISGVTFTRDTYISACTYWAKQEPEAAELSDAFIKNYCGCIYDDGVKQYGKERFAEIDQSFSDTKTASPEVNELINACITKTFNNGV
jgi:hypothetical protein